MNHNLDRWQFWIDVGGTFTDCLARDPSGRTYKTKVLSSGIAKGSIGDVAASANDSSTFADPGRANEPDEFWVDAGVRFLDSDGSVVGNSDVTGFRDGQFVCGTSVAKNSQTYELDPGMAAHCWRFTK